MKASKYKSERPYIVLLKGSVNRWWNGQGFLADIKEQAMPLQGKALYEVIKAFKVHEYELQAAPGAVAAHTEAEAAKMVALTHAKEIQKFADEIIVQTAKTGEVYLSLCNYIRKNAVAPKLVSHELTAKGFHRAVISKINRVANLPDDLYNQFAARAVGFNKVLELASESVQVALARETGSPVIDVKAEVKKVLEQDEAEGRQSGLTEATDEEKEAAAVRAMNTAAAKLAVQMDKLGLKSKKFVPGNGYTIVVKWSESQAKRDAADEAAEESES